MEIDWARNVLRMQGAITKEEIDRNFRLMAKSTHPDHGGSVKAFQDVKLAKEVLLGYLLVQASPASIETEHKWGPKVQKALRDSGAVVFKIHGSMMQEAGWPDLQIYHQGFMGHLELKVWKHGCEPLQKQQIMRLRKQKIPAYVFGLRLNGMWIEDWDGRQIVQVPKLSMLLQSVKLVSSM